MFIYLSIFELQKTEPNPDLEQVDIEKLFTPCKINSGGYGIIDAAWKDEMNVWAVGIAFIICRFIFFTYALSM
jgi:hypothetical protein